jgi:uncharacterized membrane protein YciS (DUF1049 family)
LPRLQTFENHARIIPAFHGLTFGIFLSNLIWAGYRIATDFSVDRLFTLLVAIGLILMFFFTRFFALTVQNRVIRLEMRLRLRELLPPPLRARIDDFTLPQLIALRFASDAELPALCQQVLDEKIYDQKTIKRLVRDWQGDYLRA